MKKLFNKLILGLIIILVFLIIPFYPLNASIISTHAESLTINDNNVSVRLALVNVRGYYRKDGTYVKPHVRTSPDGNPYNNFSYPGNYNPNTGSITPGNTSTYLRNYYNTPSSTYTLPKASTLSPTYSLPLTNYGLYKYGDKYYNTLPTIDNNFAQSWEGKTIFDFYEYEWYLVKNNEKHLVPDNETSDVWGLRFSDATGFSSYDIHRIATGHQLNYWFAPIFLENVDFINKWEGKTIRSSSNGNFYLVQNKTKHYAPDFLTMTAWGLIYEDATTFSDFDLDKIPTGKQLKYSDGQFFEVVEAYRESRNADISNQISTRFYQYIMDNYNRVKK